MAGNRPPSVVLFTDVPPDAVSEAALTAASIEYRYLSGTGDTALRAATAEADVIVNGFTVIDAETIAASPRLRLIALTSMGTDMVDLAAAREHGVVVTNIPPDTAADEVATHAFALLLAASRNIVFADRAVHAGKWSDYAPRPNKRLSDQTLGVIGGGRIGRTLVERFGSHFGRVLVHDPFLTYPPSGSELVPLDDLLSDSDAVSLHVPLTPDTRHLIGADEFARMKRGALLVNVGRGALVDEAALLDALVAGVLAGAGLDVLETEPVGSDHPLLRHPAVIITPHIAYHSEHSARRYRDIPVANAVAWVDGAELVSVVSGDERITGARQMRIADTMKKGARP